MNSTADAGFHSPNRTDSTQIAIRNISSKLGMFVSGIILLEDIVIGGE